LDQGGGRIILLTRWTDERIDLLAATLGMPPGSEWAHIWCVDAVTEHQPATLYLQRGSLPDHAFRFTLDAEKAAPMGGFRFDLFGCVVGEMTPHCWQINPPDGRGAPLTVEVWQMEVPIGDGLRALRVYEPLTGTARRSVEIVGPDWRQDIPQVERAFSALFMQILGNGRPRLEDTDWWPPLMREIDAYLKRPSTSLKSAVDRFDIVNLGDFDDDMDAEIEGEDAEERRARAALGKLKRWRSRWRKIPESKKTIWFP
jgi:hypothetical protein